ncbi:MAG TPA: isoprenylcysteine carboxylmethyltransferase family protein [Armatimonadota bacterium]|nr:isoprenylcysteine carboxylmethyltransferase family protein [Armatimonadota bacterium]
MVEKRKDGNGGSLLALRLAYYGEVVVALIEYAARGLERRWFFVAGANQFALAVTGLVLVIGGLSLRIAAGRTLGRWWSLRAEIREGQPLVRTGVYRVIRHPAYLGMLIVCLGIPLAFQSIWAAVVMVLGMWPTIAHRITIEERLLEQHFGEDYRAYARRTARLIPGLY